MKIAIAYASNSGSTYLVAEHIKNVLEKKFDVTMKKASEFTPVSLRSYDAVLFGSPSWRVDNQEGLPHELVLELLQKMQAEKHFPAVYAVFGTGERNYSKFCGGVDYIDAVLRSLGSRRLAPLLKIDTYFNRQEESKKETDEWLETLKSSLKTMK